MLIRCKQAHLVLNWEKCHFMATEGIVLEELRDEDIDDNFPDETLMNVSSNDEDGIDFMGQFLKSHEFEYILVAIDYMSKWAEAEALPTNNARVVINFLKKLFSRFGIPKALISNRAYHPQTNGQVENTNIALKRILKKVNDNPSIWSRKLDDALWEINDSKRMRITNSTKLELGLIMIGNLESGKNSRPEKKFSYTISNTSSKLQNSDQNEGKIKSIPFMAPFPADYRKTMSWVAEKPFIYNVVEKTCNKANLYDMDETGEGIVKGKFYYVKMEPSEESPLRKNEARGIRVRLMTR
ncbi:reverse transcriptase domain-containing protein [Tanacetum coccineum]